MEEREILITVATDWRPAQAKKAFDEQREVQIILAGETHVFAVMGYREVDDGMLAELILRGTLPIDIGEPPETQTEHSNPL